MQVGGVFDADSGAADEDHVVGDDAVVSGGVADHGGAVGVAEHGVV
jgi:hypothetical protein